MEFPYNTLFFRKYFLEKNLFFWRDKRDNVTNDEKSQ
jgi:hypothetical protein